MKCLAQQGTSTTPKPCLTNRPAAQPLRPAVLQPHRGEARNALTPSLLLHPQAASPKTSRNSCYQGSVVCSSTAPSADAVAAPAASSFQRGNQWRVDKLGGTCMSAAERIDGVCKLMIDSNPGQRVVVVSAMGSHPTSPLKVGLHVQAFSTHMLALACHRLA